MPHRLDGELDRSPRGHHDDRQSRIQLAQPVQQLEAFPSGGRVTRVVQIDDGNVELARAHGLDHFVGGGGELDPVSLALEQEPHRLQHVRLVVGDENRRCVSGHGGYPNPIPPHS